MMISMSRSALKSAPASFTEMMSSVVTVSQNRRPSSCATVLITPPVQCLATSKLARNTGLDAMLSGTHSSMAEKYDAPAPHVGVTRVPVKSKCTHCSRHDTY